MNKSIAQVWNWSSKRSTVSIAQTVCAATWVLYLLDFIWPEMRGLHWRLFTCPLSLECPNFIELWQLPWDWCAGQNQASWEQCLHLSHQNSSRLWRILWIPRKNMWPSFYKQMRGFYYFQEKAKVESFLWVSVISWKYEYSPEPHCVPCLYLPLSPLSTHIHT